MAYQLRKSDGMVKAATLCLLLAATICGVSGRPPPGSLQRTPRLEVSTSDKPRGSRAPSTSTSSTLRKNRDTVSISSVAYRPPVIEWPAPGDDGTAVIADSPFSLPNATTGDAAAPALNSTAPGSPDNADLVPELPPDGFSTPPFIDLPPCNSNSIDAESNNGWSTDGGNTTDGSGSLPPPAVYPCNPHSNDTHTDDNSTEPGDSPVPSPSPEPPPPNPCEPAVYERPSPQGVPIPPLASGEKPNFIVILTDDQGWDDIGLHNPDWVNTPNLDKFIRSATLFDNFYTSPQCAPSRAMLLTGRDYPRTGTLLVNAGYDFINSDEVTAGEYMSAAGYDTAQFGKWHNGQEMGYEPWNAGFRESWNVPISMVAHINPIFVHNGEYVQTQGYLEDIMADKLTSYLDSHAGSGQPFFAYYATHSIHTGKLQYRGNYSDPWKGPGNEGDDEGFSGDNLQFESALMMQIGDDMHMNAPVRRGRSRPVPAEYRDKYYSDPKYAAIPDSTKDAWAMLEYLDHGLGKIFDYLQNSPLRNNTYVMIGGDNGSALLDRAERSGKTLRMPGKMEGHKSLVLEGGIRNFWAVQGPGVEAGVVDSTLLNLADILPTVADLAAVNKTQVSHQPWDGVSFANLLTVDAPQTQVSAARTPLADSQLSLSEDNSSSVGLPPPSPPGYRGTSLASPQQLDRFAFSLGTQCWDFDAVPELGANREVLRPQPLLDYDIGGHSHSLYRSQYNSWLPRSLPVNPGFQPCIAVRYKEYKWIGLTNKVYRFAGNSSGSHIELPCNEVPEPDHSQLTALMSSAARAWWSSVVASPHSFSKPTAYLGLGRWNVTNMLPQGAKERTPGNVRLMPNGASGFVTSGDRMCFNIKVMRPGSYEVVLFYTSHADAAFKLSVGKYADIVMGSAPADWFILPAQRVLRGMSIGLFSLPNTPDNEKHEACLELIQGRAPPAPIFHMLANIQFTWTSSDMIYPLPQQPDDGLDDALLDPVAPIHPGNTTDEDLVSDLPDPDGPVSDQTDQDLPDWTDPDLDHEEQNKTQGTKSAGVGAQQQPSSIVATAGFEPQGLPRVRSNLNSARPNRARNQQFGTRAAGIRRAVPARGLDMNGKYSWLRASLPGAAERAPTVDDWTALRQKFGWPDGQRTMESVWSPYDQEDINDCPRCHPRV